MEVFGSQTPRNNGLLGAFIFLETFWAYKMAVPAAIVKTSKATNRGRDAMYACLLENLKKLYWKGEIIRW